MKETSLEQRLIRNPAATFLMKARGSGLAPAGVQDGDTLVVDRSMTPREGNIVVAVVDAELQLRRLPLAFSEKGSDIWGVVAYAIRALT